jgi:hypothetical protein
VLECWHRFDESYVPDEKYAGATTSYGVDSTDHVMSELEKLIVHDRYRGMIRFMLPMEQVVGVS